MATAPLTATRLTKTYSTFWPLTIIAALVFIFGIIVVMNERLANDGTGDGSVTVQSSRANRN